MKRLDPHAFLARPSQEVAPELLGWTVSHTTVEGTVTIRLTEVEAYAGLADPASHAYRGRSARNAVMFGPAGHLYVYRSMGIHYCANIVTGEDGTASAVLLRAGRVIEGIELAQSRRGPKVSEAGLARGPGNLGQALGLTLADYGTDLLSEASAVRLRPPESGSALPHLCGPRVGVSKASDIAWRYWVADDRSVSAYRMASLKRASSTARRGAPKRDSDSDRRTGA